MRKAFETLRFHGERGVATVTFDHPPVNLLDADMMTELDAVLDLVAADPSIRVLVLESADPEFFIAHGDMTTADDPASFVGLAVALDEDPALNPMMRLNEKLRGLQQLTVVKIDGLARGGGAELVSAADVRFGSERTGLTQIETPGGIIPGAGGTAYLPRLIGRARALEVILGADLVDAERAAQWGWLNRVVPVERLDEVVETFARRVASLPEGVLEATLDAVDAGSVTEELRTADDALGQLFARPAAAARARALLADGAQTRDGERHLEELLRTLETVQG